MMLHIGNCTVHESTRELEYYFNKSMGHSWTGPKVAIKSIDFKLKAEVNAVIRSKNSNIVANVGFSVIAVITDENGRIIERQISSKNFKERFDKNSYQSGSYLIGWSEGENKIVLNEIGESFIRGVADQA